MATGILGLGTSGSTGLSQELIDKLKEAEKKAKVTPIETKLETWDKELEKFGEIEAKINELFASVKTLDLFNNTGTNAFEQIVANTSGTSAMFEAVDTSLLTEGTTTIDVTQLAKRDVYQTMTFSSTSAKISDSADDKISIQIGSGSTLTFGLNQSYADLAKKINDTPGLNANIEQVGDGKYRIIIKSTDAGQANALTITATGQNILGLDSTKILVDKNGYYIDANGNSLLHFDEDNNPLVDEDGDFVDTEGNKINGILVNNRVQTAQNMQATVDGVAYNVSSNTITIQGGLNVTAVALGSSTINIEKDNTAIAPALQEFVTKYNELVDMVDGELFNADTPLKDLSSMRMILSTIKDTFMGGYGANGDLRVFNYGFELDKTGKMSINSKKLGEAVLNNLDDLKALFTGTAENKGLGTLLKERIDEMKFSNGLLSLYGDGMTKRKETLEKDKTKATEQIDARYLQLAQQFAAYTAIISQMENSFGGLKMMIQQSTSGN